MGRKKVRSSNAVRLREVEKLVKAGIERFILKEATIHEFLKTLRSASMKERVYSHQITKSVFSRIVRNAVKKRKQQHSKRGKFNQTKST